MSTASLETDSIVTLQLTLAELASVNDALACRCSLSQCTRHGFINDKLTPADFELANQLEKLTFALYATYAEKGGAK